jgi:hypothetical protein
MSVKPVVRRSSTSGPTARRPSSTTLFDERDYRSSVRSPVRRAVHRVSQSCLKLVMSSSVPKRPSSPAETSWNLLGSKKVFVLGLSSALT